MNSHEALQYLNKFTCRWYTSVKYPGIVKPFLFQDYTIATDGKAMLVFNGVYLKEQNPLAVPSVGDLLGNVAPLNSESRFLFRQLKSAIFTCWYADICDNTGCDECDSKGFEIIRTDANIYNLGVGKQVVMVDVMYLNWLEGLDNLRCCISSCADQPMLVVKHDDGFCLIMGITKP